MQAERISNETNCWIFIGAQHPNASAQFIHYTSPRLRADAMEEIGEVVNSFGDLTKSLIKACRDQAWELAKKVVEIENLNRVAEEKVQHAHELLMEKEKESDLLLQMLKKYDPTFTMPLENCQ